MKSFLFILAALFSFSFLCAQNVGIGTTSPLQKLDVNGNVKANGLIINTGGSRYDFLIKSDLSGQVGFRKAHGGLGLNYIIAVRGTFPSHSGAPDNYNVTLVGEIKLFAGNYAPYGWMLCQGQLLSIPSFVYLFSLIGITYGGNGTTTFALPDLRGSVPVQQGTSVAGYNWFLAEINF